EQHEATDAWKDEDLFDDDDATEHPAKVHEQHGDRGHQSIGQHVPDDDHPFGKTLEPCGADVVRPKYINYRCPCHPPYVSRQDDRKCARRQHEMEHRVEDACTESFV